MLYGKIRNNQDEINQLSGAGVPSLVRSNLPREVDRTHIKLTKKGWFLIHRQIWDDFDDEFPAERFTEREAWVWFISAAAYEDKQVFFNKKMIDLKRGDFATSIRQLCKTFQWGNTKVENFIKRLEKTGKISRQRQDGRYTSITICNYGIYQDQQNIDKTQTKTHSRRTQDADKTRLKNIKEDKELKENIIKVYDFYIRHSKRNPNSYKLTDKRKGKIKARFNDGFTLEQMGNAIYGILDNKYMTSNKIIDIESHLFGSREKTERWIREYEEKK